MFQKIKAALSSESNKRVFYNFLSMSFLQGANYILPLIILPYLVRVLGVEYFGVWSFITAVMAYLVLVVDYGFELSATNSISISRDNKEKVEEIFSSVFIIKFFLIIFSFLFLFLVLLFVDKFNQFFWVYIIAFGMVVGQGIFPVWFFLGMERMGYITFLNIFAKLLFTVFLFIFVKTKDDLILVAFFNSLGYLIIGIYSLYLIKKEFNIGFKFQPFLKVKEYFIEGWYVFISRISVTFYSTINTILLGLLTTDILVGYYSIAEKITVAVSGITYPLLKAIYPYFSSVYKNSKDRFFELNKRLSIYLFIVLVPLFLVLFLFSREILYFIGGEEPSSLMVITLQIFSFKVLFGSYGTQWTQILITLSKGKILQKILVRAAFINMFIAPIVIFLFSLKGLVFWSLLITLYTTLSQGLAIYKIRKNEVN